MAANEVLDGPMAKKPKLSPGSGLFTPNDDSDSFYDNLWSQPQMINNLLPDDLLDSNPNEGSLNDLLGQNASSSSMGSSNIALASASSMSSSSSTARPPSTTPLISQQNSFAPVQPSTFSSSGGSAPLSMGSQSQTVPMTNSSVSVSHAPFSVSSSMPSNGGHINYPSTSAGMTNTGFPGPPGSVSNSGGSSVLEELLLSNRGNSSSVAHGGASSSSVTVSGINHGIVNHQGRMPGPPGNNIRGGHPNTLNMNMMSPPNHTITTPHPGMINGPPPGSVPGGVSYNSPHPGMPNGPSPGSFMNANPPPRGMMGVVQRGQLGGPGGPVQHMRPLNGPMMQQTNRMIPVTSNPSRPPTMQVINAGVHNMQPQNMRMPSGQGNQVVNGPPYMENHQGLNISGGAGHSYNGNISGPAQMHMRPQMGVAGSNDGHFAPSFTNGPLPPSGHHQANGSMQQMMHRQQSPYSTANVTMSMGSAMNTGGAGLLSSNEMINSNVMHLQQAPPRQPGIVRSMTVPNGPMMSPASAGMVQHPPLVGGGMAPGPGPGHNVIGVPNAQSPGLGNPQANTQDPEKRKLIQQQLVLLLHAHKCQQREREGAAPPNGKACALPHCSTMKNVLTHMTGCQEGRSCQFPHCASSRQIIAHWKNCSRNDCPVCLPLKQVANKGQGNGHDQSVTNSALRNNLVNGMSQSQQPFSANSAQLDSLLSNSGPRSIDPPSVGPPSQSALGQICGPPSIGSSISLNQRSPMPNLPVRNNFGDYPGSPGATPSPANLQVLQNIPAPEPAAQEKHWHKTVTQDLRNHLVSKLVKAIFPSPDPQAINDQRIKDLINFARRVEKEMFEQANDREEYYHLLAEKIYKIQKELQEKKQSRMQKQNQQMPNGTVFPNDQSTPPPNRTLPSSSDNNNAGLISPGGGGQGVRLSGLQVNSMLGLNHLGQGVLGQGLTSSSQSGIVKTEIKSEAIDNGYGGHNSGGGGGSNDQLESLLRRPDKMDEQDNMILRNELKQEDDRKPNDGASTSALVPKPALPPPVPQVPRRPVKEFSGNELRVSLLPVLEKVSRLDEAIPFSVPVDVTLLNIPDYYDIIKNPMDLQTLRSKLDRGEYKDPWQFCDDFWLMLENAWLYNRKNSRVYKFCTKLSEIFQEEIDPVMQSLGFCCGRKLNFTPLALFCYGQAMCTIPRDSEYYCYETHSSQFGVTVSEKYTYCTKCFQALPGESVNLSEDPSAQTNLIAKNMFLLKKNDEIDYEQYINCDECKRKWHVICALHFDQIFGTFVCPTCLKEKVIKRKENRFTAKSLRKCKLSDFLEDRVNTFLRQKNEGAGEVIIRVISSSDKEVEVRPGMKARFCSSGELPEKFPYRTKAIFAFEVIDGVEVCFFGLHVQEYGDCPPPNRRRVYIAYLDSVYFFQPKHLRTKVYHEILLGYLRYVKMLGYHVAHIWACPPSEGDDYIFHCHPPEQKIPKPKRLQEWYKKFLDDGIAEKTLADYNNIHTQAKEDKLTSVAQLAYFEGDFWPNVLEETIRELDKEEADRRREEEAMAAQAEALQDDFDELEDNAIGAKGKKKQPKMKKKGNKKAILAKKSKKQGGTGNELTDRIYQAMEKHNDVFFTVWLHSKQTTTVSEIRDPDPLIHCELMDGRDNFLSTAREKHWEFSSLRRAKYSTVAMCYELHTQGQDAVVSCNTCKVSNSMCPTMWHCNTCEDFDLCDNCYKATKHEHELIQMLDQDQNGGGGGANRGDSDSRNEAIKRCIQSLVHACQCRDANCRRMSCNKMKRVVQHAKMCKRRQTGHCPVCKQLIALCCYHAKHCTQTQCLVPFCLNIRQKLKEQQAQQRMMRQREMQRRMMMMHGQMGGSMAGPIAGSTTAAASTTVAAPPQQQPQMNVGKPSTSNQFNPGQSPQQQHLIGQQQQMQMGRGGIPQQQQIQQSKPMMQQPAAAMRAAQEVERLARSTMVHQQQQQAPPPQQFQYQQQRMQQHQVPPQQQQQQWSNGPPQQHVMQQQGYQQGSMVSQQQFAGMRQLNPNQQQMQAQMQPPLQQQQQQRFGQQQHSNDQMVSIVQQLKCAKSPEETKRIVQELQKKPDLFAKFMKIREQSHQQGTQQQQGGPPPMMTQQQGQLYPGQTVTVRTVPPNSGMVCMPQQQIRTQGGAPPPYGAQQQAFVPQRHMLNQQPQQMGSNVRSPHPGSQGMQGPPSGGMDGGFS